MKKPPKRGHGCGLKVTQTNRVHRHARLSLGPGYIAPNPNFACDASRRLLWRKELAQIPDLLT